MKINGTKLSEKVLKEEARIRLEDTAVGENIKEAVMEVDADGNVADSVIINVRSLVKIAARRDMFGEVRGKCKSMLEFLDQFELSN